MIEFTNSEPPACITQLMLHRTLQTLSATLVLFVSSAVAGSPRKAQNVIVVTLDGFRWQELFDGGDESLMDSGPGGVRDVPELRRRYLRDTVAARREALIPFFWSTIARQGQVFGNPAKKSAAKVTNGLKFSYPGYSEAFCGVADARVDSNAKKPNPNLSVLEFLDGRPGFENRVEAVCTWDVFPSIFRAAQSGLRVQAGWQLVSGENLTDRELTLNEAIDRMPKLWANNHAAINPVACRPNELSCGEFASFTNTHAAAIRGMNHSRVVKRNCARGMTRVCVR